MLERHGRKVAAWPTSGQQARPCTKTHPGVTTEIEVARNERDEAGHLADFRLRLDEAKQLTAALHIEMVSAQLAVVGERRGLAWCTDQPLSPGKLPSYFSRLRSAWGMSS